MKYTEISKNSLKIVKNRQFQRHDKIGEDLVGCDTTCGTMYLPLLLLLAIVKQQLGQKKKLVFYPKTYFFGYIVLIILGAVFFFPFFRTELLPLNYSNYSKGSLLVSKNCTWSWTKGNKSSNFTRHHCPMEANWPRFDEGRELLK